MRWLPLSILLLSIILGASAVGFEINPGSVQCFWEGAVRGSAITTIFQVTHGGYLDVDVEAFAPDGKVLYTGNKESSGKFSFMAQADGKYKFCFGNMMSSVSNKIVTMDIVVRPPKDKQAKPESSGDQNVDALLEQLRMLHQASKEMTLDGKYLAAREWAHQTTLINTRSRVYNWAMFEIVTLIVMTFLQLFYLRAFFEGSTVV